MYSGVAVFAFTEMDATLIVLNMLFQGEAILQDMVGHGAQFLVARFSMVPDAIFTTQSEGTGALDGKSPSITKMVVLGGD